MQKGIPRCTDSSIGFISIIRAENLFYNKAMGCFAGLISREQGREGVSQPLTSREGASERHYFKGGGLTWPNHKGGASESN